MKKIYILSILTAGLVSLASCTDDNVLRPVETNANGDEVITDVIVTADDFIPQTRTSINNSLTFTWSKNDKIGVYPGPDPEDPSPSSQVLFTASDGGAGTATFNGSGWGLMPSRKYYAYFPYSSASSDSLVKFTFTTTATQLKNDTTSHLGANDLMYASANVSAGNMAQFQFHHLSSIVKLEISVPAEAAEKTFKKVILESADTLFPLLVSFNPTVDAPVYTVEQYTDKLYLTLGNKGSGFTPVDGKLSVWFMIGAVDLSGKTINVTTYDGKNSLSGTFSGADQKKGRAHLYTASVVRTNPENTVDLGLPSGIYWAPTNLTMNGLAESETALGDYYAWGDTIPYYTSITIKGATSFEAVWRDGYEGGYTKDNYDKNTKRGIYTKATDQLSLADDAAHSVLGGHWRMPSKKDLDELAEYCTLSSATVNNAKGVRATSKINGNSIFMPCNGYITGNMTFKGYTSNSPGARFWLIDCASETQAYQQYGAQDSPAKNYDSTKDKWRGTPVRPIYVP